MQFDNVNYNFQDKNGLNLFYWACHYNNEYAINQLLEKDGVEYNCTNPNGRTAFHICCKRGKLDIVEKLLQKGVQWNTRDKINATPFQWLCYHARKYTGNSVDTSVIDELCKDHLIEVINLCK